MKIISFLFLIIVFTGCRTGNDIFYGTTGSRHGIKPYPSKEQWIDYINDISETGNYEPAILWIVGSYHDGGIKFNFPGKNISHKAVFFSDIDINEQYLEFFDKKNVKVFLYIEPGRGDLNTALRAMIQRYSHHKCIVGVAIDLEWYKTDSSNPFGSLIQSTEIEDILTKIKSFNAEYKLLLKHWDINKIEKYDNKDLLYLQSMEGIKSLEELIDRHKIWSRFFYPNSVGSEVGFVKDMLFWSHFDDPINDIPSILDKYTKEKSSFFWSETSLYEVVK